MKKLNKKVDEEFDQLVSKVYDRKLYPVSLIRNIALLRLLDNISHHNESWSFIIDHILASNRGRLYSMESNKLLYSEGYPYNCTESDNVSKCGLFNDCQIMINFKNDNIDELPHDEIWKLIRGYSYAISNKGRIFSSSIRNKSKILTLSIDPLNGYNRAALCKNSKIKRKYIHRLVAEAFIPNPENKAFIKHIDGNKRNNTINNLRWTNRKDRDIG